MTSSLIPVTLSAAWAPSTEERYPKVCDVSLNKLSHVVEVVNSLMGSYLFIEAVSTFIIVKTTEVC